MSRIISLRAAVVALALTFVGTLGSTVPAGATVGPATVLDGPANNLLEFDGAALAPDGTGGVVYRKTIDGVAHVFVARVQHGAWRAPVIVDGQDPYGASQPAIAAGNDGRLLVVWVQPRATSTRGVTLYELMSATVGPGASTFGPPILVDANVGEPFTGDYSHVTPQLAMSSGGDAYVVYRVVDDDCSPLGDDTNPYRPECPATGSGTPTASVIEVRVSRFTQGPWSSIGTINRAPQLPMRLPATTNAPSIAIGANKAGLVTWQEPDANQIARVYARRLFGTTAGNPIQLSPTTLNGQQVTADADAPVAAFNDTGLATAAFRLRGGLGSPLRVGAVMSQTVPSSEAKITDPTIVARGSAIGPPSLATDDGGDTRLGFALGGAAFATNGSGADPRPVGPTVGPAAPTTVDPNGGGVTTWLGSSGGLPLVGVRDDLPAGAVQSASLVGGLPGQITGLSLGAGGTGDAAIGWMQGPAGASEIVGDFVSAAPKTFTVMVDSGWHTGAHSGVTWNPAASTTTVTYALYVDGKPRLTGIRGPAATAPSGSRRFPSRPVSPTGEAATISRQLPLKGLGSGTHQVQVQATDANGQTMLSSTHTVKVDRSAPIVNVALIDKRRGVRVTIADPDSGVAASRCSVSFGDRAQRKHRATVTHDYRMRGRYVITAHVRDHVGNRATVHLPVVVR